MATDPYRYFRIEARELLDQLSRGLLDLEQERAPEPLASLLRAAHTLKGAARIVKQREIADLAHAVEEELVPFRDRARELPAEPIGAALRLVDGIAGHVAALPQPGAPPLPTSDTPDTSRPATAAPGTASSAPPAPPAAPRPAAEQLPILRADVSEIDELVDGITEAHAGFAALREKLVTIDRVRRLSEVLAAELRAPPRAPRPGERGSQRAQAIAEELTATVAAFDRAMVPRIEQVDRELRQIREEAERLRLLPARLVFSAFERAVRDAAQGLGRRALFTGKGGEVRVDAEVLTALQSALAQIARNAVAHGIEPEVERIAAGKPPAGRVALTVRRRGGRVSFACEDDGRGVDLAAVAEVAQRRGLSRAEAQALGPDGLLRVLLRGGISTAGTVTEVAGRGIGLDIVRDVVTRLGGEVAVRTEAGRGTTIELEVPVSMSSIDALLVEAGGRTAAIPLEAVHRTIRVAAADIARTGGGAAIAVEGEMVPFAPLVRALRAEAGAASAGRAWSVVVVESGGLRAAIGVDRLVGTESLVLRSLPPMVPVDPVIAGAAFDVAGNPRPVLDPDALIADARRVGVAASALPAVRAPILVVDDSLTTRMLEQSILESAGYQVDLATSGEEGLSMARRRPYALFLVDVEMPGMDGFEFVSATRADPELRGIPSILVTSRGSAEDRQRGEAVGARAHIVKSEFDQNELIDRIRRLVS